LLDCLVAFVVGTHWCLVFHGKMYDRGFGVSMRTMLWKEAQDLESLNASHWKPASAHRRLKGDDSGALAKSHFFQKSVCFLASPSLQPESAGLAIRPPKTETAALLPRNSQKLMRTPATSAVQGHATPQNPCRSHTSGRRVWKIGPDFDKISISNDHTTSKGGTI
jgi:hypothetical protein